MEWATEAIHSTGLPVTPRDPVLSGVFRHRYRHRAAKRFVLLATFHIDLAAVGLEQTFQAVPGLEVEAERIAAHSTAWTMPCLWAANADFDAVDEALREDPTVDRVVEADGFGDEKYYQVEWADEVVSRIDAYVDEEGSVIDAHGTGEGWKVQFRFASREQLNAFREQLQDEGFAFELRDLVEPGAPRQSTASLTPRQRDALVAALERGYYEVPREISARELAAELDTSHQALSELLRRGTAKLVDSSLTTPTETDGE